MHEIVARFTSIIARADLTKIRRIAGTLAHGTRRDLILGRQRARAEEAPMLEAERLAGSELVDDVQDVAAVRARLSAIVGDADADMVIAVVIERESYKTVAERMRLSKQAVHQRLTRARRAIRKRYPRK